MLVNDAVVVASSRSNAKEQTMTSSTTRSLMLWLNSSCPLTGHTVSHLLKCGKVVSQKVSAAVNPVCVAVKLHSILVTDNTIVNSDSNFIVLTAQSQTDIWKIPGVRLLLLPFMSSASRSTG